ncbi:SIMPL domain-containing protein [Lachnospiraceae bacterium C1.1]|nr:SIMPL domain-containing protein [Lachnospiraceae bacterium C1.1]
MENGMLNNQIPVNNNNNSNGAKGRSVAASVIIAIAILGSAAALAFGLTNFRSATSHTISATGSASKDFESNLIVWNGSYSAYAYTSEAAYDVIKKDKSIVEKYLKNNGLTDDEISFSAVSIQQRSRDTYDGQGNYTGSVFDGYDLSQSVTITSSNLDQVELISTDVSSLLDSGIEFESNAPEYYYTNLDELKFELIDEASKNSKQRIDIIAKNAGANIGKLANSSLGVFQITAANSGTSDYTYDGYFDTSSRYKTATITVRLEYSLK